MMGVRNKYARRLAQKRYETHLGTWWYEPTFDQAGRNRFLGRLRKTPCHCSNELHGNPRRHFCALTKQELCALEASRWDLEVGELAALLPTRPAYKHRRFDAHLGWNRIK